MKEVKNCGRISALIHVVEKTAPFTQFFMDQEQVIIQSNKK